MEIDVNVLPNVWTNAGIIASIIIAAAAVFFGIISLVWRNRIPRRDRKERILGYILDWATEIHTTSLRQEMPYIPPMVELKILEMEMNPQDKDEIVKGLLDSQRIRSEGENSFLYAAAFSRQKYIRQLALKGFGKNWDALHIIDEITKNLFSFIYLGNKKMGMQDPKKGFTGKQFEEWAKLIEDELTKPNSAIDTLSIEYASQLARVINNLFICIADTISKL